MKDFYSHRLSAGLEDESGLDRETVNENDCG